MVKRKKKVTKADFIPAGVTPFDNGKVKMGIYYQKPKYVEYDSDMLEIQKWLIGDPDKLRLQFWIDVAYKVTIGFIIIIMVLLNTRG